MRKIGFFQLDKITQIKRLTKLNDTSFGALAQLGERLTGSQEVSGSIPLCSTTYQRPAYNSMWVAFFVSIGFILLSPVCCRVDVV